LSQIPNKENCFKDVGLIINKQACLYSRTALGSEWGEYFNIKVLDTNGNIVFQ